MKVEAALWHALYSLEVRYWHDVDTNDGRNAHTFYVPDGIFQVGDNAFCGCSRIREFYAWREQRGLATVRSLRTTRHLISNFRVEAEGPRAANAFGVVTFLDAPGRAPVMQANPAILIADIVNACVRDGETWR